MSKKKKKSDKTEKKAKVHKELEGFEIKINPLGEITSSYSIDQLNEFLDKNVYDKKLTDKGLEKPGGKPARDDEDDYHVEETEEEEENPEDFIKEKPAAKLPSKKAKTEEEDEEEDLDDLDEDEEARPKKR
jgi:hypothetical protein